MEKPAKLQYTKKRYRLLKIRPALSGVFLCVLLLPLFAQHGAGQKQQYDPILHIPATTCTVGDSLTFVIQIAYIEPANVRYVIPPLPPHVRLIYAKKDLFVHFSGNFTNIELTLAFEQAGTVELPPLEITAENVKHHVVFPEITVVPQLFTILPQAFWQADTADAAAGDAIDLTLVIKNVLEITAFSCEAPEDSLLEQRTPVQRQIQAQYGTSNTQTGIAAASFTWTPLRSGTSLLPSAKLTVHALDGGEQVIYSEPQSIRVLPAAPRQAAAPAAAASMRDAFTETSSLKAQIALLPDSGRQIAEFLAELRGRERKSLLPQSAAAERKAAEEQAGLPQAESEPAAAWLIPLYAAALLCAVVTAILSVVKKRFAFAAFVPLIGLLFLAAALHVACTKPCAVTLEAAVKTVPEVSATTAANLKAGTRVRILSSADGWLHIRYDDTRSGWLPANSVIYINGEQP